MGQDPDEKNRLFKLLWLVGVCVEFPKRLGPRIGGHPDWNRHVMYKAIQDGYIQVYRKKVRKWILSSLRLTDKGIQYVAERDPGAAALIFSRHDEMTAHSSAEKILRRHSLSTAFVMAYLSGAHCLPDEKPALMRCKRYDFTPVEVVPNAAYFYSPQEIRRAVEECEPETVSKSSRLIGAIVKDHECFCLYDTGRTRMFWMHSSEENAVAGLQMLLNARGFHVTRLTQIVIGQHMNVALRLCRHENRYTTGKYFTLSDFFSACCFLTNDANGDALLKILLDQTLQSRINQAALKDCIPPAAPNRDYDAVSKEEHRPVTLNYKCDLLALSHFNPAPYGFSQGPILLCFDYQVPALQHILGPSVEVRAIKGGATLGP